MKINSGNDHRSLKTATEHEALFSFGFVNNSAADKGKVKESLRYLVLTSGAQVLNSICENRLSLGERDFT